MELSDKMRRNIRNIVKHHNYLKVDELAQRQHLSEIISKANADNTPVLVESHLFCCDTGFYTVRGERFYKGVMEFIKEQLDSQNISDGPGWVYMVTE